MSNGMKEGEYGDPFEDDPESGQSDDGRGAAAGDETETTPAVSAGEDDQREQRHSQQLQIPYVYRRDSVKDGRDRRPFFLREETQRAERTAVRELEEHFDADIPLTDVREALVLAGLDNLDAVEDQLAEWGHGMTFEE